MGALLDLLPREVVVYLSKVTLQQWIVVGDMAFSVFFILVVWFLYYCFRRLRGHQKFKGDWYTAEEFQVLLQELYTGVREGRLPDSQTMKVLDRYIYGKTSELRKMSGNGWL